MMRFEPGIQFVRPKQGDYKIATREKQVQDSSRIKPFME